MFSVLHHRGHGVPLSFKFSPFVYSSSISLIVIQSEAKDLEDTMEGIHVDVHEIFRYAQQHVFTALRSVLNDNSEKLKNSVELRVLCGELK